MILSFQPQLGEQAFCPFQQPRVLVAQQRCLRRLVLQGKLQFIDLSLLHGQCAVPLRLNLVLELDGGHVRAQLAHLQLHPLALGGLALVGAPADVVGHVLEELGAVAELAPVVVADAVQLDAEGVEVARRDAGEHLCAQGVAAAAEDLAADLVPLPVDHVLLVDVGPEEVLVDVQEGDDGVLVVHEDIAETAHRQHAVGLEVVGVEIGVLGAPLDAVRARG
eukprot:3745920-Rhodomonas_salina.1